MAQKNYAPRHAAHGVYEYPQTRQEYDPELEQQIKRYQAQRRRKKARRLRILHGALIAAFVALFAFAAVKLATGHRDGLKGTWTLDSTTVYEFDGKGGGALCLPLNTYEFSYTAENGTLAIDFADHAASDAVYRYSVRGSTLTLDNGSMTFTLEKNK